ncbi:hypothetical protein ACMFMG_001521 [Clarireedia jacksonii]
MDFLPHFELKRQFGSQPTVTTTLFATPTSSSTSNSFTSASASQTSPTSISAASSALSTGAKAGIGVGASAGAIFLFLSSFFLWLRRRRTRKAITAKPEIVTRSPRSVNSDSEQWHGKAELQGSEGSGGVYGQGNADVRVKSELPTELEKDEEDVEEGRAAVNDEEADLGVGGSVGKGKGKENEKVKEEKGGSSEKEEEIFELADTSTL